MQSIRGSQNRKVLKIIGVILIFIVLILYLVFGPPNILNKRQFIAPTNPSWHYTNGTWEKADEPDWGEVMKGKQTGTRAKIETDSSFAILKQRGYGGELAVFVDGKFTAAHTVKNDGKLHELPVYSNYTGWHRIEVVFSTRYNEIDGLYISNFANVRKPEDNKKKLVVIGHSYAEGCCLNDKGLKSFAAILGDILGVESINAGIGRTDIDVGGGNSALNRVQSDVIDFKPDYVLSVYGLNAMRNINTGASTHEQYEADYAKFIKTITDSLPQTHVFASGIASVPGWTEEKLAPFNQDIKNACSSVPNCTFIDLSGKWNDDNFDKYLSRDGIHPSEEGHQFLAEEYAKIISTVMKE